MKLIFGIICLIICTYIGHILSKKYVKRRTFFSDFSDFNKKVKNEISFSKNTLIDIIKNFSNKTGVFYLQTRNYFNNKKIVFEDKLLSEQEQSFFKRYLDNLGVLDKTTQIDYLELVEKEIEEKKSTAILEEEKYKKLYLKLGFLIGLIMLIMLL